MQKNTYLGKFIVFEGLDGSGQTTQAAKLNEYFNASGKRLRLGFGGSHLTKEPTNNLIGGLIRGQLTGDWKTRPECLQLLFTADRAHHLEKEIVPLLEQGTNVISDRYFFTTIAYGAADGLDWDWLKTINSLFLLPDVSFFLKVSPAICLQRMKKSRFSLELFEREEFLEKAWRNFERLAKEFEGVYIIDGERPVDAIAKDIIKVVERELKA